MLVFDQSREMLIWGDEQYHSISGPHGKGPLPAGMYTVKKYNVVDQNLSESFTLDGVSFFIPLQQRFEDTRGGFGIHPDGYISGTLGCVGLQNHAVKPFWYRWMNTPLDRRPDRLYVTKGIELKKLEPMPLKPIPIELPSFKIQVNMSPPKKSSKDINFDNDELDENEEVETPVRSETIGNLINNEDDEFKNDEDS